MKQRFLWESFAGSTTLTTLPYLISEVSNKSRRDCMCPSRGSLSSSRLHLEQLTTSSPLKDLFEPWQRNSRLVSIPFSHLRQALTMNSQVDVHNSDETADGSTLASEVVSFYPFYLR